MHKIQVTIRFMRKLKILFFYRLFFRGLSIKLSPLPRLVNVCQIFKLSDVHYFASQKVTLETFKGKWLFLDFWFTGCTSCINSFPKINRLQQKFGDRATFMLVGLNETQRNKDIVQLYEKFRKGQKLNIPIAYDSILVTRWKINSMPHVLIINPEGVLYNISDGRDFTENNIRSLLDGDTVKMWTKNDDINLTFDDKAVFG